MKSKNKTVESNLLSVMRNMDRIKWPVVCTLQRKIVRQLRLVFYSVHLFTKIHFRIRIHVFTSSGTFWFFILLNWIGEWKMYKYHISFRFEIDFGPGKKNTIPTLVNKIRMQLHTNYVQLGMCVYETEG